MNSNQDNPAARTLLSFIKCVGAREKHEVYLSTPITTGRAFVTWRQMSGSQIDPSHPHYESQHYANVIALNLQRVPSLVAQLRARYSGRLVIDPTSLEDISGWEQEDYLRFWCSLIEEYVAIAIFAEGWQFSTGCIGEFATALRFSAEIYSESFAPLSKHDGEHLIRAAIAEVEELSLDSEPLRLGLRAVESA